MTDPIPKHIESREQWEVEDHISFARTGEMPVNPAYVKARNEALEAAGLEPDMPEQKEPDEMTVEEHFQRQRSDC